MQTVTHIGVDVSKAKIDFCINETGARGSVANSRPALSKWLGSVRPGSRIAMEASGEYHELLAELAHARGFAVFVLNPKRIRHYAQSIGLRAKTDRVDAVVIARYVAKEHAQLHRFCPLSPEQRQLKRLLGKRAKATSLRSAAQASFQNVHGLDKERAKLLRSLDALVVKIDRQIAALIAACPQRQQHSQRLQTIDGVGPVVGAALLSSLERIPFASPDAFVAYHGMDTRVDDSGTRVGRRRLSKSGPSEPRRLVYVAAMAAVTTTAWKPLYEKYLQRGLPRIAALCVIARHILRTAWSIYKHKTTFDPARLTRGLT